MGPKNNLTDRARIGTDAGEAKSANETTKRDPMAAEDIRFGGSEDAAQMRKAQQLIELASPWAAAQFRKHGGLSPMYHGLCANDDHVIIPVVPEGSKDAWVAVVRAAFAEHDVVSYVFICEAWLREATNAEADRLHDKWLKSGIANDPKRIEVVLLNAEDAEGMVLARRPIIRHRGRPHLGDLKVLSSGSDGCMFEGRMVGLLPARGTRQ